ncbi:hypothetical protein [Amycolatopsis sp. H20-H5]|uniref:hypothetical protein n=1 Tax=Amycolatopsis sp. H20-H5 TaxID=3046309 RepID=UPI002DB65257|nr:hypothetical protein [Amycolatopsis sp. H20-H5]MEC3978766.1 hypothetical protein [Amycolatopsis sp. H20-H5]
MTASALTEVAERDDVPGEVETAEKRGWGSRLAAVFAVLAGVGATAWHATAYGHWIVDDAAITFSYARSFAEGLGPVLQPGAPPVEGFSDPTWMVLLGLGKLAGLFDTGTLFGVSDYVLFPKLLGLLFVAGTLAAFHLAARHVLKRAWVGTLVAGLTLAAIPSYVIWVVSGLENSLFGMAVVWLAVLLFVAAKRNQLLTVKVAVFAGVLVAFAALTRPEGLIYGGAYPLVVLFQLRRSTLATSIKYALISIASFAVPFGAYVVWRYSEFHRLLANPSIAKKQGLPDLLSLARPFTMAHYIGEPAVVVFVAIVLWALIRAPWRRELVALVVPMGLAVVAFGVLEKDWMGQFRFATPVWALGALTGTLCAAELLKSLKPRLRALVALVVAGASVLSVFYLVDTSKQFQKVPTIPACLIADRFGRGFNTYADILGIKDASLLLPDLGGSSMTSRLHLVDMAGLVESDIADLVAKRDMPGLRDYVFDKVKPTFIHSWGPWAGGNGIVLDPRIARDYTPIWTYRDQPVRQGDWVRKDAVTSPEKLAAVRAFAEPTLAQVEQNQGRYTDPQRDCGPTLTPGQTVPPAPPK